MLVKDTITLIKFFSHIYIHCRSNFAYPFTKFRKKFAWDTQNCSNIYGKTTLCRGTLVLNAFSYIGRIVHTLAQNFSYIRI